MQGYFAKIIKEIYTKEDLLFYLEEIDSAIDLILKEPKKSGFEKLKEKIATPLFNLLAEVKEKEKQYREPKDQVFFLELLKKFLISLPKVKIEMAIEPERETLIKISDWFERELGKKFILDVKINPKILGGLIIEYNGKWRDFSLAKKLKTIQPQD